MSDLVMVVIGVWSLGSYLKPQSLSSFMFSLSYWGEYARVACCLTWQPLKVNPPKDNMNAIHVMYNLF